MVQTALKDRACSSFIGTSIPETMVYILWPLPNIKYISSYHPQCMSQMYDLCTDNSRKDLVCGYFVLDPRSDVKRIYVFSYVFFIIRPLGKARFHCVYKINIRFTISFGLQWMKIWAEEQSTRQHSNQVHLLELLFFRFTFYVAYLNGSLEHLESKMSFSLCIIILAWKLILLLFWLLISFT